MRKRTWFISTDLSAQLGQAGFQPQIHLLLNCFGLQVNSGKSLLRVCSRAQEKQHVHSARKPAGRGHRRPAGQRTLMCALQRAPRWTSPWLEHTANGWSS